MVQFAMVSMTTPDPETTNTLFDQLGNWAPEALSAEEQARILSDIASLRAEISDMDTACACERGAFKQWCIEVRAGMRLEVAMLWQRLEA